MREGSKQLRRLGFAAVVVLAVSATGRAEPSEIRPAAYPPPLATAGQSIPPTASASTAHGFAASPPG